MDFLVTGGNGFLGSHLVEALVKKGTVTVLTNIPGPGFIPEDVAEGVDIIVRDILTEDFFEGLGGFDVVFHLAAFAHPAKAEGVPDLVRGINVDGTRKVCDFVAAKGGRLVFSSTGYVYGDINYSPIDERHPQRPKGVYGESKRDAEAVIMERAERDGTVATILRLFNIYGPRQGEGYLVPTVVTKAVKGEELRFGNGDPVRDFTYVVDVCECFQRVAFREKGGGEVYNIGSNHGIMIRDLVRKILDITGRDEEPVFDPALFRENELMELIVDNRKVVADTGWRPTTPLDDGLRKTVDYYKSALER